MKEARCRYAIFHGADNFVSPIFGQRLSPFTRILVTGLKYGLRRCVT